MKSMSFKKKLILSSLSLVLLFSAIIAYLLNNQNKLGSLQDEGAGRFKNSESISQILLEVSEVYAVAADAQINHNLNETKKDLSDIKKKMSENVSIIQKMADTGEEKKWAEEFKVNYEKYVGTIENELLPELEKSEILTAKTKELDGKIDGLRDETLNSLKLIYESLKKEAEVSDTIYDQTFKTGIKFSLIAASIIIILTLVLSLIVSSQMSALLNNVKSELLKAFELISDNTTKVAKAAESLSESSTEQASAIQETSASMEEMNTMIKRTAESASESTRLSRTSAENAVLGKKTSEHLIISVNEIDDNNKMIMAEVQNGNAKIGEIVNLINEIGVKTKVINDIVFQTKLLSFNASVEAARAGEQGKGFQSSLKRLEILPK